MFGLEILEIVIGLIFIYLLLSLLVFTVSELAMKVVYSRGKNLNIALQTMLDDENDVLCKRFFAHPLITKLKKKGNNGFPSYISNEYFSKVIVELLYKEKNGTLKNVEKAIDRLPDGKTKEVLHSFARDAKGDLDQFKVNIGKWYEEVMDQATGWYKVRVQQVLFVIGMVISIVFNADSLRIAQKLSINPEARQHIIAQAYDYVEKEEMANPTSPPTGDSARYIAVATAVSPDHPDTTVSHLKKRIYYLIDEEINMASSALGMGWKEAPNANLTFFNKLNPDKAWWQYVLQSMLGWLITAFAITLGAPFWFDLLKKIMSIRAAGEKPEDKKR